MTPGSSIHQPSDQYLSWEVDPFAVKDAPRGTVVRHPLLDLCFWVRGSGDIYFVQAWRHDGGVVGHCPCLGFAFRRYCAHVRAVAAYLARPAPCPVCRGTGLLHASEEGLGPALSWMDDEDVMRTIWG